MLMMHKPLGEVALLRKATADVDGSTSHRIQRATCGRVVLHKACCCADGRVDRNFPHRWQVCQFLSELARQHLVTHIRYRHALRLKGFRQHPGSSLSLFAAGRGLP